MSRLITPIGAPSSPKSGAHIIERIVRLEIEAAASNRASLVASAERIPVFSERTLFKIVRLSLTVSSASGLRCFCATGTHVGRFGILEQDAAPVGLREDA